MIKTSNEIQKIPIIFEESVDESPISRIVFEDKTNLDFKTHPSDSKIISVSTLGINLLEGKHTFYIYINVNMLILKGNVI